MLEIALECEFWFRRLSECSVANFAKYIFSYIFLHFSGCGRLYCGLCPEPAMSHDQLVQTLVSELFPRGLIYRPSFSSDCMEADIQEIRGKFWDQFQAMSFKYVEIGSMKGCEKM